jgi:AAA domain
MTPASVLRGPRRVGKTVLLRQLIAELIAEGVNPQRILYIAFDELPTLRNLDEPVLAIARWYEKEVLATTFNAAAHEGPRLSLLFERSGTSRTNLGTPVARCLAKAATSAGHGAMACVGITERQESAWKTS